MKVIQIEAFGNPAEVVKAVDVPDVGVPAAGEGVIALETSPINQYDILMIAGGYGYRPRPPAIMARKESAAAVGARVKHLKEGDRTLVPFLHPTWAERIKTGAPWLRPLPPGDINQFAMMGVNPPTAYLLLTDINEIAARTLARRSRMAPLPLSRGQPSRFAKSLGLRTVNIVRRDEVEADVPTTLLCLFEPTFHAQCKGPSAAFLPCVLGDADSACDGTGCTWSPGLPESPLTPLSASLNPRIPFPSPCPSSGSFLGPKTRRAITRMRIKCVGWSKPSI